MTVPSNGNTPDSKLDAFRIRVQHFVRAEIQPEARRMEEARAIPRTVWRRLGEAGLLGLLAKEANGDGTPSGYLAQMLVMEEISQVSPSLGLAYCAHANMCLNQIWRHASPAQKQRFLPGLIAGTRIGAMAMTEPGAGSDIGSLCLRAERHGDCFLLNGQKSWVCNGPDADLLLVYARTDPAAGHHGLTALLVEKDTPGLHRQPRLDSLGMRAARSCHLSFQNCRVPAANVLGTVNGGIRVLMSGLDVERAVLSAGPVGIMQAVLDLVLPFVRTRHQFDQAIGEFQLIQAKLADIYTDLQACRAYAHAIGRQLDALGARSSRPLRKDCAGVFLYCAEKASRAANHGMQIMASRAYEDNSAAARLWRDARLYEIGAGTSEIRRVVIGRALFDEQADQA